MPVPTSTLGSRSVNDPVGRQFDMGDRLAGRRRAVAQYHRRGRGRSGRLAYREAVDSAALVNART
jgi:hypothetical protein